MARQRPRAPSAVHIRPHTAQHAHRLLGSAYMPISTKLVAIATYIPHSPRRNNSLLPRPTEPSGPSRSATHGITAVQTGTSPTPKPITGNHSALFALHSLISICESLVSAAPPNTHPPRPLTQPLRPSRRTPAAWLQVHTLFGYTNLVDRLTSGGRLARGGNMTCRSPTSFLDRRISAAARTDSASAGTGFARWFVL